eukprot:TRINITY_DN22221_c0_g1_i2.p1 TRINITY_DN22221_c0_g1~~TRINITY_DN22221_c0_g1_i2.p1  ORF type:complete len:713 (-),score=89.97 TRINITY_DN22221_c0_g1_i2:73-2211(-)
MAPNLRRRSKDKAVTIEDVVAGIKAATASAASARGRSANTALKPTARLAGASLFTSRLPTPHKLSRFVERHPLFTVTPPSVSRCRSQHRQHPSRPATGDGDLGDFGIGVPRAASGSPDRSSSPRQVPRRGIVLTPALRELSPEMPATGDFYAAFEPGFDSDEEGEQKLDEEGPEAEGMAPALDERRACATSASSFSPPTSAPPSPLPMLNGACPSRSPSPPYTHQDRPNFASEDGVASREVWSRLSGELGVEFEMEPALLEPRPCGGGEGAQAVDEKELDDDISMDDLHQFGQDEFEERQERGGQPQIPSVWGRVETPQVMTPDLAAMGHIIREEVRRSEKVRSPRRRTHRKEGHLSQHSTRRDGSPRRCVSAASYDASSLHSSDVEEASQLGDEGSKFYVPAKTVEEMAAELESTSPTRPTRSSLLVAASSRRDMSVQRARASAEMAISNQQSATVRSALPALQCRRVCPWALPVSRRATAQHRADRTRTPTSPSENQSTSFYISTVDKDEHRNDRARLPSANLVGSSTLGPARVVRSNARGVLLKPRAGKTATWNRCFYAQSVAPSPVIPPSVTSIGPFFIRQISQTARALGAEVDVNADDMYARPVSVDLVPSEDSEALFSHIARGSLNTELGQPFSRQCVDDDQEDLVSEASMASRRSSLLNFKRSADSPGPSLPMSPISNFSHTAKKLMERGVSPDSSHSMASLHDS